jgi:hypothetical protein
VNLMPEQQIIKQILYRIKEADDKKEILGC